MRSVKRLLQFCFRGSVAGILLAAWSVVSAATLVTTPSGSTSIPVGSTASIAIVLNTENIDIQGVDIRYLRYDPTMLEVQDDDSAQAGVQILKGTLMIQTLTNTVNTTAGEINFSQIPQAGISFRNTGNVDEARTLATIRVKALREGAATLSYDFTAGSTTDTNVASNGSDVLTAPATVTLSITAPSPNPDTQAPTTPSSLTATVVSTTVMSLSWTTSTDNVGVTGYELDRCSGSSCTNFLLLASPTNNSYSDTGLTANTAYRYRVRARDAAGNTSAYSPIASGTTQANPPPPSGGGGSAPPSGGSSGGGGSVSLPPVATATATPTPTATPVPIATPAGLLIYETNPAASSSIGPVVIRKLTELASDGARIPEGGSVSGGVIVFSAQLFDANNNRVKLEVELRRKEESFTGTPTMMSNYVNPGETARVERSGLTPGEYKFRARASSINLEKSEWLEFGNSPATDFIIRAITGGTQPAPVPTITPTNRKPYPFTRTLRRGIKGPDVLALQNMLKDLGYDTGVLDGWYGLKALTAIKDFQRKQNLGADGIFGPKSQARFNIVYAGTSLVSSGTSSSPIPTSSPTTPPTTFARTLRRGTRGNDVKAMQEKLNKLGLSVGTADGSFGPKTFAQVKAFQEKYALTVDGVAGPKTLEKLNSLAQ